MHFSAISSRYVVLCSLGLAFSIGLLSGCGGKKEEASEKGGRSYLPADEGGESAAPKGDTDVAASSGTNSTQSFDSLDPNELESQFESPILPSATNRSQVAGNSGEPISQPPSLSQDDLDAEQFVVPVGDLNETMAFIQRMQLMLAEVRTAEEEIKIQRALSEAADVIFRPEADLPTRMGAIRLKGGALQKLAVLGDPNAQKELDEYCDVLVKNRNRSVAALGHLYRFASTTAGYFSGEDGTTFEEMKSEYAKLVAEYNDQFDVFEMSVQMVQALDAMDRDEEAKAMLALAADAFGKSSVEQMQIQAVEMRDQLKLMQLEYAELRDQVQNQVNGSAVQLLDATRAALSSGTVSRMIFSEIMHTGKVFELVANYEAAKRVYEMLQATIQVHPDEELQRVANMMIDNGLKRVSLVGTKAEISGVLENGTPLDWPTFRQDKYVLVIFWSTRWPDALASFKDYDRIQRAYADRGLEILGINMDQFPQEYEEFQSQFRLPWPNITSANAEQRGVYGPMGQAYGADSPPFNMLVDKNGIITHLHLYGTDLDVTLAQIFGVTDNTSGNEELPTSDPSNSNGGDAGNTNGGN